MAKNGAIEPSLDLRGRIDSLEKDYSRLRWVSVVLFSIIGAIFFAGFYFKEALITYSSFRGEIGKADALRSELVRGQPNQKGGLSSNTSEMAHDASHIKFPIGECPQGQYAAGVKAWGNAGGPCAGCFNGIQIICRPFVQK